MQTDENKLRQVLINLLENAIKFTKSGSVILRLGLLSENISSSPMPSSPSSLRLQFQVEDTGNGIASEELKCIFDAFVQSNPTYQTEDGTGLGLAICKRFVQLMGGDIEIKSKLGKGTIVQFNILVDLAEKPAELTEFLPKERIIGLKPNQANNRILVVEDNWENRQLLLQILVPLGFEVIEATNGEEAIELWELEQPNLNKIARYLGVEYIYESENDKTSISAAQINLDKSNKLTPEALKIMPEKWRASLHEQATSCNQDSVLQLLSEIPEHHQSLKMQLEELADNYQFEEISKLVNS